MNYQVLFNSKSLCSFLVFMLFLGAGFSIKCWVCHSDADPKCADPFDNSTLPIKDCREVRLSHLTIDEGDYQRLKDTWESNLFPQDKKPKPRAPKLMEATMCRKIRQKIHGNWRTIRSCAFLGSPGEGTGNEHNCLYRQGTHDIYLEYCTCNSKDGCNSVDRVTLDLAVALLIVVVGLIHF